KTRYTPECSTVSPGLYSLPMALPFKMELGLARLFRRLPRQPTAHELRNFGLFSRPLPVPLAPPYGPSFPDLFHRAPATMSGSSTQQNSISSSISTSRKHSD